MKWEIIWHPKAAKNLETFPKELAQRVFDKLDTVAENPFRYLEHFEGEGYKLRIGGYRALLDIDFQNKVLKVRVFDKRGRVYE